MGPIDLIHYLPQKEPFRFLDEIIELDDEHICGKYTFKENEYFYQGHFPNNPVTPGVILIEAMAQTGVVALGIYLLSKEIPEKEIRNWISFFTDCHIEFFKMVPPQSQVIIKAKKQFWRRKKLQSSVQMYFEDGTLIAQGIVSGLGVKNEQK